MRRIRELPHVEKIVSIGIRSLRTRREDVEAHRRDGNEIHPPWTLGPRAIEDILPKGKAVYVSFDIDGLDPAVAPGTGTPEPGGLSYEQVRAILAETCRRNRVVGIDLVEVAPVFDHAQVTALNGAMLLVEALGALFGARE
jgi:agmatinase